MDLQVFVKTEMELKIMAAQIEIAMVKKLENEEKTILENIRLVNG